MCRFFWAAYYLTGRCRLPRSRRWRRPRRVDVGRSRDESVTRRPGCSELFRCRPTGLGNSGGADPFPGRRHRLVTPRMKLLPYQLRNELTEVSAPQLVAVDILDHRAERVDHGAGQVGDLKLRPRLVGRVGT